jgi:hypothetical protein
MQSHMRREPVMSKVRWIGLDVHAETIAVAVAECDGEVRALGVIPNQADSLRRLVKRLGPAEHLRACYEAGPTGYVVYWQLTALGVSCEVVAPPDLPDFFRPGINGEWRPGGVPSHSRWGSRPARRSSWPSNRVTSL